MNRRHLLFGSGVTLSAVLAGCIGGDGNTGDSEEDNGENENGGDGSTEPLYNEGDHKDLLLTLDDFPEGWTRDDELNENFDAVFLNDDRTILVMPLVEIEPDIEAAKENYQQSIAGTRDPQDYPLGDEAFWDTRNDEIAVTLFRHSNAVGQVAALRESGMEVVPDQSRSQQYAEAMFKHWESE